jgi:hypothetical protein
MEKMKFYEYECKDCKNGSLFVNILLNYPCPNCFDGKRTWLDDIIPPSKKKYESLKKHSINKNIQELESRLKLECSKIGIETTFEAIFTKDNHKTVCIKEIYPDIEDLD